MLHKIGDFVTVKHLDEKHADLILVSDSQEIKATAEAVGFDAADYGCLFVEVGDGDYNEIWGCFESVPWLNLSAEKLL